MFAGRWVTAAAILAVPVSVCGQDCITSGRATGSPVGYNSIQLVPSGMPSDLSDELQAAYGDWNKPTCNPGGSSFPLFTESSVAGARLIDVVFSSGFNPKNTRSCGNFGGSMIFLYQFAETDQGATVDCRESTSFQDTVAHELGHLLGLNDSSCQGFAMSQRTYDANGNYVDRQVSQTECDKADATNETPEEREEAGGCGSGLTVVLGGQPSSNGLARRAVCNPGGSIPDGPNSPILVDLDGGGFDLTDLADGVWFDVDRDGVREAVSWTSAASADGWLALDRNGNGTIDDGGELFGNYTDQPLSAEPNGYAALLVLDEDGDRKLTVADSIFPRLQLWVDSNHDGVSQPAELRGLSEAGVLWLGLEAVESRHRDRHGNEFRYHALVRRTRGVTQSVDVFLLGSP